MSEIGSILRQVVNAAAACRGGNMTFRERDEIVAKAEADIARHIEREFSSALMIGGEIGRHYEAPAQAGVPVGFWLAPIDPDAEMLRAGFYWETDERVREFWNALRDHWLARTGKAQASEPPQQGKTLADFAVKEH